MKVIIRYFMTMCGFLGSSIFIHEMYHVMTKKTVSSVCLQFGGDAVAYVSGKGYSSEIIAYTISFIVVTIGIIFATYDLLKTKDLKE